MDSLEKSILLNQKKIYTDKTNFTIGEIINRYEGGTLVIDPIFQRLYRWTLVQKSKFIESIFLGMPIPPIFVAENENSEWELVDGLQRVSTILEFVGVLKKDNSALLKSRSIEKGLIETPYLGKNLDKLKYSDLSQKLVNKFTFSRLDVNVLLEGSDENIKFDLFDRLNSLASVASSQEKRRSIIIMKDKGYYNFLLKLKDIDEFKQLVTDNLPENDLEQLLDEELLLRFFSIKSYKKSEKVYSISDYIDSKIDYLMKNTDKIKEKEILERTMLIIYNCSGVDSFRRLDLSKKIHLGRFILPVFDVFAGGIGYNLEKGTLIEEDKINDVINNFWLQRNDKNKNDINILASKFGTGVEAKFKQAAELGRKLFSNK